MFLSLGIQLNAQLFKRANTINDLIEGRGYGKITISEVHSFENPISKTMEVEAQFGSMLDSASFYGFGDFIVNNEKIPASPGPCTRGAYLGSLDSCTQLSGRYTNVMLESNKGKICLQDSIYVPEPMVVNQDSLEVSLNSALEWEVDENANRKVEVMIFYNPEGLYNEGLGGEFVWKTFLVKNNGSLKLSRKLLKGIPEGAFFDLAITQFSIQEIKVATKDSWDREYNILAFSKATGLLKLVDI